MILSELIYRHIFRGSIVRKMCGATIRISDKAIIRNSRIVASPGTNIIIKDKCIVDNVEMYLNKGSVIIGDNSILSGRKNEKLKIIVNNGMMEMADHSKLSCRRIWLRFGGCMSIGRYTNINEGSEIRCDECVEIGSYNQISYNVRIWDTNTHSILDAAERRRVTEDRFPYFGYESERPATAPVKIGDDCWIGENAAILKGTELGNGSVVGFGTFLTNKKIPDGAKVVNERPVRVVSK